MAATRPHRRKTSRKASPPLGYLRQFRALLPFLRLKSDFGGSLSRLGCDGARGHDGAQMVAAAFMPMLLVQCSSPPFVSASLPTAGTAVLAQIPNSRERGNGKEGMVLPALSLSKTVYYTVFESAEGHNRYVRGRISADGMNHPSRERDTRPGEEQSEADVSGRASLPPRRGSCPSALPSALPLRRQRWFVLRAFPSESLPRPDARCGRPPPRGLFASARPSLAAAALLPSARVASFSLRLGAPQAPRLPGFARSLAGARAGQGNGGNGGRRGTGATGGDGERGRRAHP